MYQENDWGTEEYEAELLSSVRYIEEAIARQKRGINNSMQKTVYDDSIDQDEESLFLTT